VIRTNTIRDLPRVAIVGAGVCGLGVAWRLAQAGCDVHVFDKGEAGHGATWAAAGMLAAGVETEPGEERLLTLTRESQKRWPRFAADLETESGTSLDYRDEGTLVVATNRDELDRLRFDYEFQRSLGVELHWLNGRDLRAREPYLRSGVPGGVYSPNDHQVDNRRLAKALKTAVLRAGGHLHERTPVESLMVESGRACGVTVKGEDHRADVVLLAAGPWSRQIPGVPPEAVPPVRPIKGQMLSLRMDPASPLLKHVVWAPKLYMVPRRDGRLLIGATVEEKNFDSEVTAGGLFALLEGAWRAVPAIEELPLHETWVGFRPGSRDDAPIVGFTRVPGLAVATGHHRNGILLAPVTADLMAEAIASGALPEALQPFSPERFAGSHESAEPKVLSS
jgi:glycine oxidase